MAWIPTLSSLLEPTPTAILITILVVLTVPLFLHLLIFRSASSKTQPTILLIGPSGSGKTSLLTLFERGHPTDTRPSQTPLTVEISLPITTKTASSRYRSAHDPTLQIHKRFLLADTPGHGKLRHHSRGMLTPAPAPHLKGIIFMVDAADLAPGSDSLRQAATYLHDTLLLLQEQQQQQRPLFPFLLAANKLDLFTALPPALVKSRLEAEISQVRASQHTGLMDSGGGGDGEVGGEEKGWLGGEGGSGMSGEGFSFAQMEGVGVGVEVVAGCVRGAEGPDVDGWWGWIGGRL